MPEYPILSILSSDYERSKLPGKDEKKNLPQTMHGGLDPHLAGPRALHAAGAVRQQRLEGPVTVR